MALGGQRGGSPWAMGRGTASESLSLMERMVLSVRLAFCYNYMPLKVNPKDILDVFEKAEVKFNAKFVKHQSATMQQLKEHKKALQYQMMTIGYPQAVRKLFW